MDAAANPRSTTAGCCPTGRCWQTDLRQTVRSWVYVIWVAVSVLAAAGYLLYRFGLQNEGGIVQKASIHSGDLLKWLALGSLSLIVVLTVSSISSERGTLGGFRAVASISRHQYFLAKWHSRMLVVMATYTVLFTRSSSEVACFLMMT